MRRRRPQVVVYTRARCGLCHRAEALVAREARRAEVRHVDVDRDPALVARYGVRVPVVEVDGSEVAELELAPGTVRRAATGRSTWGGGAPLPSLRRRPGSRVRTCRADVERQGGGVSGTGP
jgi:glutaredoxin